MLIPHPQQENIVKSKARFKIIRSGRRAGKTSLQIEEMVFCAVNKDNQNIFYICPTQAQARSIVWEALKSRLGKIGSYNEQRLEVKVPTAEGGFSLIKVSGWESRENFRGMKAHLIVFDELDTMRDFFIGWQEIFRPALTDTAGKATFIGTPKKENPNLRRLEKIAETDNDYKAFHFPTHDNPHIPRSELEKAQKELDQDTYRQEYLAEYVDNAGSLFGFANLVDVFSNTVIKDTNKYLVIDVADDGSDSTVFSFWEGLEEYRREKFNGLRGEGRIAQTREYASQERIPMSHIIIDAIGVGADMVSHSLLTGVIGYKSSYSAIKTDMDIVRLPNVHYSKDAPLTTDYANLRSQCIFTLANLVNNHKIASRLTGQHKESIIEELATYQDISKGDGKRLAMGKDQVKEIIGHSPDDSDTWIMRMYFEIIGKLLPGQSEQQSIIAQKLQNQFDMKRNINRNKNTR